MLLTIGVALPAPMFAVDRAAMASLLLSRIETTGTRLWMFYRFEMLSIHSTRFQQLSLLTEESLLLLLLINVMFSPLVNIFHLIILHDLHRISKKFFQDTVHHLRYILSSN